LKDFEGLTILYNNKAEGKERAALLSEGQERADLLEEAITLCERSLDLSRNLKAKRFESYSETVLGMCYRDKLEWDKALEHFNLGIQIKESFNDRYGLAYSIGEMAIMDLERGLLDRAEEGITKAIASFFSLDCLGDARRLAKKLQRLADAFRVRGNENRAQELTQLLAISLSKAASTSK
jgi:tetratricopeptide (TPR) repeat protein